MNTSEQIAKAIVENVLRGVTLCYRSEQSSGEHDFDLHYPGGRIARLEVTMATDAKIKASIVALTNERKGGSFVTAEKCREGWYVHPLPDANFDKIRSKVDEYLARIEASGIKRFSFWTDALESEPVASIFHDLKIEAGSVAHWKDVRKIGIAHPGQDGSVTPDYTQKAVETEANKTDNRRKLDVNTSDESHLFVLVDPLNYLPWVGIVDAQPPSAPPHLPMEISHLWVAAQTRVQDEFVVWRAQQGEEWIASSVKI